MGDVYLRFDLICVPPLRTDLLKSANQPAFDILKCIRLHIAYAVFAFLSRTRRNDHSVVGFPLSL